MKTARDVIKRVNWDEGITKNNVVVGYMDRFVGIVEKPFTEFSWTSFAETDPEDIASIPEHRIQYFKYRSAKIWDKKEKLDLVFQTGSKPVDSKTLEVR